MICSGSLKNPAHVILPFPSPSGGVNWAGGKHKGRKIDVTVDGVCVGERKGGG